MPLNGQGMRKETGCDGTSKGGDYPLHSIYFYPTESCNLRCIHCWIRPQYAPDQTAFDKQNRKNVSVGTMERVVREALPLGLSHIKVTGGEPFLNPRLLDYLDAFSKQGLSFSIETNGTLITEEVAKRLRTYPIRQISVSLDGSTPAVHEKIRGEKGCYQKTLMGIAWLVENDLTPQLIFCLQEGNALDLENTIRMAGDLGIRSFEINPLALFGPEGSNKAVCRGPSLEDLLDLEKRVEGEFSERYPEMDIDLYLPPAVKGIKELSRHSLCGCQIHHICGILSNGDVSICGIGRRKKNLVMGNVHEKSIALIWRDGAVFQEIRKRIPFGLEGVCGRCLFKYHCLGFCRADVLSNDQSLVDSFQICDELFQKGLFPSSRMIDEKAWALIERKRGMN
jgi:SynChlorMet cassette radical SAM/SPASM protein ScmF